MVNSVYFNKEQFENGEMDKFIHQLNELSYGSGHNMFQVLIRPEDCGAYVVEFVQVCWEEAYGEGFRYVRSDQKIYSEYRLPDNSYIEFETDEEYNEYLEDWLKENPGWVKTFYGTWTNEIENEKFRKELSNNGTTSEK